MVAPGAVWLYHHTSNSLLLTNSYYVAKQWLAAAPIIRDNNRDGQRATTAGGRLWRTKSEHSTVSSRKYFAQAPQNALSRSRARGRRPKTPRNGPLAPVPQAPHHARAPAEDDPPRSHPSTGAHAPAASSPRARSAGQPIIASCNMALSGRVTAPL